MQKKKVYFFYFPVTGSNEKKKEKSNKIRQNFQKNKIFKNEFFFIKMICLK